MLEEKGKKVETSFYPNTTTVHSPWPMHNVMFLTSSIGMGYGVSPGIVCVCVRERERERESVCVCVCVRACVCVCVHERESVVTYACQSCNFSNYIIRIEVSCLCNSYRYHCSGMSYTQKGCWTSIWTPYL